LIAIEPHEGSRPLVGKLLVATAIVTTVAFPVAAACRSSDLVGAWSMSAVGFSGAGALVGTCDFVIATDGAITGISLDPQTINQFTAVKFDGRRRFAVPHERE
jgi:hypothetical protein